MSLPNNQFPGFYFFFRIHILEPDTSWKFSEKELARRNTHGVPRDKAGYFGIPYFLYVDCLTQQKACKYFCKGIVFSEVLGILGHISVTEHSIL